MKKPLPVGVTSLLLSTQEDVFLCCEPNRTDMPIKLVSNKNLEQGPGTGAMRRSAYEQARLDFQSRVLHEGTSPLRNDQQQFSHADLLALVAVLPGSTRLVIVHLGLENGQLRYGFSFRAGTERDGGLDYLELDHPTHLLFDKEFVAITPEEWRPFHDAYRASVFIRRQNEPPVLIDEADAKAVVLPWDTEINEMYRQTASTVTGRLEMKISSVAVLHDGSDSGHEGFRHGVSFHVVKKNLFSWEDLLREDEDSVSVYRHMAVDYGNLCPPRCRRFER